MTSATLLASVRNRPQVRFARTLTQFYFVPAGALAVILLITDLILQPNFGWAAQLATFAPAALAAAASMPAVLSGGGGIDLSVSPTMVLVTAVYVVWLVPHSFGSPLVSIPVLLLVGALVGVANGLLVTVFRLTPIVATLCTYFIITGVNLLIAPSPQSLHNDWTARLADSQPGFPGAVITLAIPIVVWFVLARTGFIRSLLAVGSNDAAAYSAGLPVLRLRVSAYALGGVFAAVGGLAIVALVGSVDASTSTVYTVPALVSVAIGGIAIEGGRGGITGPLLGAAVTYLLGTLLTEAHIAQAWLQVVNGGLLVGAVIFSKQLSKAGRGKA